MGIQYETGNLVGSIFFLDTLYTPSFWTLFVSSFLLKYFHEFQSFVKHLLSTARY